MVDLEGAMALVGFLKSEQAKRLRKKFREIIRRYIAGDSSLHHEIVQNSESVHPLNQMARQSIEEDEEEREYRRVRMRMALYEESEFRREKRVELSIKNIESEMNVHERCGTFDENIKLQMSDRIKNLRFMPLLLTNGTDSASIASDEHMQITISQVADDLGIRLSSAECVKAGKLMVSKYRDRYNKDPEKHKQSVNGAIRLVNTYMQKDIDLMKRAISEAKCDML